MLQDKMKCTQINMAITLKQYVGVTRVKIIFIIILGYINTISSKYYYVNEERYTKNTGNIICCNSLLHSFTSCQSSDLAPISF